MQRKETGATYRVWFPSHRMHGKIPGKLRGTTAINIVYYMRADRCEYNSGNEHLRASITVNVGQCVFIRGETGLVKLEISGSRGRALPRAGERGREGKGRAREEAKEPLISRFHTDMRENFVWHLQPPLRE